MFKMIGWFSKFILSAVIISCISMFTTWYTVNLYVKDLLTQLNLNTQANKLDFADFMVQLSGHTSQLFLKEKSMPIDKSSTDDDSVDVNITTKEQDAPEDAVAVWNQVNKKNEQTSPTRQQSNMIKEIDDKPAVVMTTEDFHRKKELLSNEDKMKIFSMLVSRIPQDQMQKISLFVEDGITSEELREVESIVVQHLKSEEYKQLMQILNKY